MRPVLICLLLLISMLASPAAGGDWPAFRGVNGSAVSDDDKVPTTWSETKNHKWKLELPGKGWSSPIVVGKNVFVSCFSGEGQGLRRYLVCVDRDSGKAVWTKTVPSEQQEYATKGGFGYNGYASHTPVSDGERIYVLFGTTGVLAFDMKGEKLWQKSVGTGKNSQFGSASSPILYKDLLIVTAGNESTSFHAFDKKTGKEVWKENAASLRSCYSTPSIAKNKDGVEELVISTPEEVWSLNPTNGKLKWYATTSVDRTCCTSLVGEGDIIYAVGGLSGGRTAVRVGGKDDVTKSNVLWSKRGGSYVGSPVLYKGYLYWVDQRGSAVCIDAKTGEEAGRKRISGGYYASAIAIKDKLYAVSRDSGTYVLEANPKMKEIAHNKLSDDSDFSGSPAVSNGQLFLRSDKYLHCIAAE